MNENEVKVLNEISKKLDTLVSLFKLSNQKVLDDYKKELKEDKTSAKILELADGTLSSSQLVKKVAEELGIAEITVRKRLQQLKDRKILTPKKKGKEVYYEDSGLLD